MANKRTEVRTAFVTFLAGKIPAITNILGSRHSVIAKEELPLINVYCGDEQAEVFDVSPRRYKRTLEVVIEIYHRAKEDIDGELEEVMRQVEYHIDREDLFTLYNDVAEIIYTGARISPDGREATQETGVATIRYNVIYFSRTGEHTDDLPEFDQIDGDLSGAALLEIRNLFT